MLSINTNLSSLIAQNSMSSATKLLNQAVERMTTGYKINHSKDNAANYSISQKMNMQISSFDVAADNVAMGMDLVTTASDIISNMQDKASRLQALCTQARNGTYGQQSMQAINSEAAAIMAEINRLYNTAEYNNVSLFNKKAYEIADHLPQAGENGFIEQPVATFAMRAAATPSAPVAKEEYNGFIEDPKTYTDEEVAAMTKVADVSTFTSGEKYSISTVEELQKLADYVNAGNDTTDVEFVLGADIDLSSIANWTPIGNSSTFFNGYFDGNGHVIKNLTIDNPTEDFQGLFGCAFNNIINVGLENVNIRGKDCVGGLLGDGPIALENCYVTGNVNGNNYVGGLSGTCMMAYSSYSNCNVTGNEYIGGLVGSGGLTNSYTTGTVNGVSFVGGLCGEGGLNNSYSSATVTGVSNVGGLVGFAGNGSHTINCYSTGNVSGTTAVGGIAGLSHAGIENCYSTGDIVGEDSVGGLIGCAGPQIVTNSYFAGNVTGEENVGGLVGVDVYGLENCYSVGNVIGESSVGGLLGKGNPDIISNSTSYSNVYGNNNVGAIVGKFEDYGYSSPLDWNNVKALNNDIPTIGCYYSNATGAEDPSKALAYEDVTNRIISKQTSTTLQVGIKSDSSNQISFDTNFELNFDSLGDLTSDEALASIMNFQALLSDKATALGAVENRLQSAIESIEVNIENLTSSLSTIRDADIAEVSSEYIRQQILQQASATLLSTANQSPSIALQLI